MQTHDAYHHPRATGGVVEEKDEKRGGIPCLETTHPMTFALFPACRILSCSFRQFNRVPHDVATVPPSCSGNSVITTLDLGQNGIGDRGAKALAEAIKLNTTLTRLDLSGNAIDTEGAGAWCKCVVHVGAGVCACACMWMT